MNTKIKLLYGAMGFVFLLVASCANNEEMVTEEAQGSTPKTSLSQTAFTSGSPLSRTAIEVDRIPNNYVGKFFWTNPDRIWSIDNNNHIQVSGYNEVPVGGQANATVFYLPGTYIADQHPVYYAGSNATAHNRVTIQKEQVQEAPNVTKHLGVSGDCGTAIATRQPNGEYNFVLTHRASYICFWARTSDPLLSNARLVRIEVIADGNIAGTYELSHSGLGSAPVADASSTITLKTGATEGFLLDNVTPDYSTNPAFMVIAPGTHTLSVNYWVKLSDGREGTVVQALDTKTFEPNVLYNITCNLAMPNCDSYVFEPVANYPDKRDFSPVNDLFWYVDRGNPTLEKNQFWTHNGNVYQGGLWLKRKGKIPGFDSNVAPNGINYITKAEDAPTVWATLTGATTAYHQVFLPYTNTPVSAKDYFFLPNFTVAKNPAELWHADYCSQNTVVGHSDYIWYLFFNGGRVGVHIGPAGLLRMPPIIPKYAVFGQPAD